VFTFWNGRRSLPGEGMSKHFRYRLRDLTVREPFP
jgi:hypothetical protein